MPQIGWFELLLIVVIAVLVIGPKEFPIVLRKLGNWIGATKRYISNIQNDLSEITEIEKTEKKDDKKDNE